MISKALHVARSCGSTGARLVGAAAQGSAQLLAIAHEAPPAVAALAPAIAASRLEHGISVELQGTIEVREAGRIVAISSSHVRRSQKGSVAAGAGVRRFSSASATSPSSPERIFWVQRAGAADFAKLTTRAGDVGDLKKDIKTKLKLDTSLDSITLQLASDDGKLVTAKDKDGNDAPVSLAIMDTIDEALKKALGRDVAHTERLCIVVKTEPMAYLPYRLQCGRMLSEPLVKAIASEADFAVFISGCRLVHVRGTMPAACTGGKNAAAHPHVDVIGVITNVYEALEAAAMPDTFLVLRDNGPELATDLSNLKRFRDNAAVAFEMESNKALARDEQLRRAYGELQLMNDGRSVTFYDSETGSVYVEVDGVIANTTVALINEARSNLHVEDVKRLTDTTLKRLKRVLSGPDEYRSDPPAASGRLAGLAFVPVVSAKKYSPEARAECAARGVHLLESDGSGYRCILHDAPAVAAVAIAAATQ